MRFVKCDVLITFMLYMSTTQSPSKSIFQGIYTIPDAAHILRLPLAKLHRWLKKADVEGVMCRESTPYGLSKAGIYGEGIERHINFLSLIELFTIDKLRQFGIGFAEIRAVRSELSEEYKVEYPFALKGLLSDGRKIVKELSKPDEYLILNTQGQRGFRSILKDFFTRIDFEQTSQLAECYYPHGKEAAIVVDPRISFGRPTIKGTAIAIETLEVLSKGGEPPSLIAEQYAIRESDVQEALRFATAQAA